MSNILGNSIEDEKSIMADLESYVRGMFDPAVFSLNNIGCEIDYTNVYLWAAWYSGYVQEFHDYTINNGDAGYEKKVTRKRLEMAKTVCEEKTDLVMNDNFSVSLKDSDAQKFIDSVLDDDFKSEVTKYIELMYALGTTMISPYRDGSEYGINYYNVSEFQILSTNGDDIVSVATINLSDQTGKNNEKMYDVTIHLKINDIDPDDYMEIDSDGNEVLSDDGVRILKCLEEYGIYDEDMGGWLVINKLVQYGSDMGSGKKLVDVDSDSEHHISPVKLFSVMRPNSVNNKNLNSKYGISCFSGAIPVLQSIDETFDSQSNEFVLGKKRIYMKADMALSQKDADGKARRRFMDENIYIIDSMDSEEGDDGLGSIIKESDMTLRVSEHIEGMNANLDKLSLKVGLGSGYYRYDGGVVKTATEVISKDSKLFRRIKKDEKVLNKAFIDLIRGLMVLYNMDKEMAGSFDIEQEVKCHFDDSIIIDQNEVRKNSIEEINNGLADAVDYYMTVYNMTEEEATKKYEKLLERKAKYDPLNLDWASTDALNLEDDLNNAELGDEDSEESDEPDNVGEDIEDQESGE